MGSFKELGVKELREKLSRTRADLLDLRLKKCLGSPEKPHVIRALRREVARLETFVRIKSNVVI
ncbi:MAG: 50S ribosomal protein L29 [Puniceicoccales bacterium]|jgi:large subunit ribosomal protein L29|nr:50S ribosomal protein L29 [Puniceicoccales bacterium]